MRAAYYLDSTALRIFRSNVFNGKANCFSHDVSQSYVSLRVCGIITAFCAPMAQWIEHRTSNPTVAGSSPAGRARIFWPERDLPPPAFLLSKAECILAPSRAASTMVNFPIPYDPDAPLHGFQEETLFHVEFPARKVLLQDPAVTAISSTIRRSTQLRSARSLVFRTY